MEDINLVLTNKQARMINYLRLQAIEHDVICMQAPIIWDGENSNDVFEAQRGCNGVAPTADSKGFPPCPIRALCLDTALAIDAQYGVWGGTTPSQRAHLQNATRRSPNA